MIAPFPPSLAAISGARLAATGATEPAMNVRHASRPAASAESALSKAGVIPAAAATLASSWVRSLTVPSGAVRLKPCQPPLARRTPAPA